MVKKNQKNGPTAIVIEAKCGWSEPEESSDNNGGQVLCESDRKDEDWHDSRYLEYFSTAKLDDLSNQINFMPDINTTILIKS